MYIRGSECAMLLFCHRLQAAGSGDGVVKFGAEFPDPSVIAGVGHGVDAIAEQDDEQRVVRVDPDTGAGVTGVAESAHRKITPGGGFFRTLGVPAEATRAFDI